MPVAFTDVHFPDNGFPFLLRRERYALPACGAGQARAFEHAHRHIIELQYIQSGMGYYSIGGRLHAIGARMLCIMRPGVPHCIIGAEEAHKVQKMSLLFDPACARAHVPPEVFARWFSADTGGPCRVVFGEAQALVMEHLLGAMSAAWGAEGAAGADFLAYLLGGVATLLQMVDVAGHRPDRRAQGRLAERLERYVEAHFSEELTLDRLARAVRRSPCHVSRVFHETIGMPFVRHLAVRRVAEARRLLEDGFDGKLSTLARRVGFRTASTFNRAFLQMVGVPPSRYRVS